MAARPEGYRVAAPPGSPLRARNQSQRKFATWIGYVVIGLAAFAWLFGGRLQHMLYQPVQNKIMGVQATPNPAERTFITGAAPTASPPANSILRSDVSTVFSKQSTGRTVPQPPIDNRGAQQAGLPTMAPDYAKAASLLRSAQTALNGSGNSVNLGGGGYLPLPGEPGFNPQQTTQYLNGTPTPMPSAPPRQVSMSLPSGGVITYPVLSTPAPQASPAQEAPLTDSLGSQNSSVYMPSRGGVNYVGLEPGQQTGMFPQSAQTMRVAQQAQFLGDNSGDVYSDTQEEAPRYACEVYPTDPINARLTDSLKSNLPGLGYFIITQDVKCHVPGDPDSHPIAIPAGTVGYGPYNADVQQGDERLQLHAKVLIFTRIAYTLVLADTQGADEEGANGLPADVDNHVGRVNTIALIGTVFAGLANMATGGAYGVATNGRQLFAQGATQSVLDRAQNAITTQQQQPPTLTVKSGTDFTLHFSRIQPLTPYNELVKRQAARRAQQWGTH